MIYCSEPSEEGKARLKKLVKIQKKKLVEIRKYYENHLKDKN